MLVKSLRVLLMVALLTAIAVQPLAAAAKTVTIKVTFVSEDLVSNDSVGNEWETQVLINGKAVAAGDSIKLTLKPSELVKLEATAIEQDKIPDVGTANKSFKASTVTSGKKHTLDVKVVENRGRYSGNAAKWKFVFQVEKA
ncbi:hypothetical protein [Paenibacillus sp. Leaf72]|uniref:hypothetical protein n=1 Tax=Paenibacillus sp. Leaf72 TaxID=1736234 RepID=UPI0006FF8CA1|nr:hypothetical protein [Paenibacillus sp. Leaf72]KQN96095.1 hypothetical protein ASF12_25030 [Paenibacillus sp. Leaf72]